MWDFSTWTVNEKNKKTLVKKKVGNLTKVLKQQPVVE